MLDFTMQLFLWVQVQALDALAQASANFPALSEQYQAVRDVFLMILRAYGWPV